MTTEWIEPTLKSENDIFVDVDDWSTIVQDQKNLHERIFALESNTGDDTDLPKYAIFMWHGTIEEIPEGFQLADGTNGLPDLRGLIPMGAADDAEVGSLDGSVSHLHGSNGATGASGSHSHTYTFTTALYQVQAISSGGGGTYAAQQHQHYRASSDTSTVSNHTHQLSNTGLAQIAPPVRKLFYIGRRIQ